MVQQMGPSHRHLDTLHCRDSIRGGDDLGSQCVGRPHQENDSHRHVSHWVWAGEYPLAAALPAEMEGKYCARFPWFVHRIWLLTWGLPQPRYYPTWTIILIVSWNLYTFALSKIRALNH